jgi:hypothetical protein
MGLLFLLIGLVLGPIPFVGIIGLILDIIGAILVILGRGVFGPNHSRNVILAVVIFVIGLCVIAGSILSLFLTIFSATYTASSGGTVDPTALSQAISSSFQTFIIGTAVGGAIDGVAIVLFTYAIQNQNGKMLLWAGYAISIAVSIITILVVGPLISEAVTQAFAGSTFNPAPVSDLQAQAQLWGLLGLIPSILYAGAFYLVRSRIDKGQVLKPRNILRS